MNKSKTWISWSKQWTMIFNKDWTKLYAAWETNPIWVSQYNLSTAYDISTLNTSWITFSMSWVINSIYVKKNGSRAYINNTRGSTKIDEYSITNGDITSATYIGTSWNKLSNTTGIWFSSDGTRVFMLWRETNVLRWYNLNIARSISSIESSPFSSLTISNYSSKHWLIFNPQWTQFFLLDRTNKIFRIYDMATPRDVSTATNTNSTTINSYWDILWLAISWDGKYVYVINLNWDIYQFSTWL